MNLAIKKFDIHIADLKPRFGTEPGKVRPVVVVQTDLLNQFHPSVIICPLTTKVTPNAETLRVFVKSIESDIIVDQVRAIDKKRLHKKIGRLKLKEQSQLLRNLQKILLQ